MNDFTNVNIDVLKEVYEELAYGGDTMDSYYRIGHDGWGVTDEKRALWWLENNEFIRPSLNFDDEKCDELERFFNERL